MNEILRFVNFWDNEIFSFCRHTKISVTRSIFEIQSSSFGFSPPFMWFKNPVLQVMLYDQFCSLAHLFSSILKFLLLSKKCVISLSQYYTLCTYVCRSVSPSVGRTVLQILQKIIKPPLSCSYGLIFRLKIHNIKSKFIFCWALCSISFKNRPFNDNFVRVCKEIKKIMTPSRKLRHTAKD